MVGPVMLIAFIGLMIIGVPLGFVVGIVSIVPSLLSSSFTGNGAYLIRAMISAIESTPLLAIPLFVFSGDIMSHGGISKRLFDVAALAVGKKTAGMPIAVVITCLFYGAISGSSPATTAAVGTMCIPILVSLGYDPVFCAAIVATAGGLGVIIPPSIPFVTIGMATGLSVGQLFIAGIIPGCLVAFCLIFYTYVYCKKHGEDKEKIQANYDALKKRGTLNVIKDGLWALATPVFILGGIYGGIVTPTEAACISVIYSLIICLFVYKTVRFNEIWELLRKSVRTYGPLCLIIIFALAFGKIITLLKVPKLLSEWIITYCPNKYIFLLVLNVILLIMGMFMDTSAATMIFAPILLPTAQALGINGIHFGVILCVNLAIGLVSPPFGLNLFVAAPLIKSSPLTIGKKALPWIGAFLIALALITYVPKVSLLLLH